MHLRQFLKCPASELNLSVVLLNGQSFRWKKVGLNQPGCSGEALQFIGVAHHRVWKLWREDSETIGFQVLYRFSSAVGDDGKILENYFQLSVPLRELYKQWSEKDEHFRKISAANPRGMEGIRILAQDPLETVFAFICSSNNNVKRISSMVEKLCEFYGESANLDGGSSGTKARFYDFADLPRMANDDSMEAKLRQNGFGYRAAYVHQAAKKLMEFGAAQWLMSLAAEEYPSAKQKLELLPGVGPKVADCICLMGLRMNAIVPVDTHVFKLTAAYYLNSLSAKKSVSKEMYKQIGQIWFEKFGTYAGWAHSVLFSTQLRHLLLKSVLEENTEQDVDRLNDRKAVANEADVKTSAFENPNRIPKKTRTNKRPSTAETKQRKKNVKNGS